MRTAIGLFLAVQSFAFADAPRVGFAIPCEVVEWHDGDTCTVRVTVDVRVRLIGCWAPEVRGHNVTADEKARGQESLKSALKFAPVGSKGVLEVPLVGYDRTDDAFTMGRLLGRVWIDGKDVSALQVSSGHATAVK